MALADVDDYRGRHGDTPEDTVVQALLDAASSLILDEVDGSEAEWVTTFGDEDATVAPQAVKVVCVEVAYRAFKNPAALEMLTLGGASYTFRGNVPDAMYLTARELRIVRRAGQRSSFRSVTMETPYSGDTASETMTDIELPLP